MTSDASGETDDGQALRLVCVVDDDTSVLRSLWNLLDSAGLPAETFGSAEAFLESDRALQAGCLVLDLQLPQMSGIELFMRLMSAERRVPIVILTAERDPNVRQRLLREGAIAFLTKPFRAADVLVAVKSALALGQLA